MTNKQIIYLVNSGILTLTTHTIPSEWSFQVYKFRKAISKAIQEYSAAEKELLSDAGIDNPTEFDKRYAVAEGAEKDEMTMQIRKYTGLRDSLLEENVPIEVKCLPYDVWKSLQDENKANKIGDAVVDVLCGGIEETLEGVLWTC